MDLFVQHINERSADKDAADGKGASCFSALSVDRRMIRTRSARSSWITTTRSRWSCGRTCRCRARTCRRKGPAKCWARGGALRRFSRQELAGYYAQIENWAGRLARIDTLTEKGILANTHIMIFADHGDMHGSHGLFRKTNPYEEVGADSDDCEREESFYDQRRTGRPSTLFGAVDIAPTTLGLCGLPRRIGWRGTTTRDGGWGSGRRRRIPDSIYLER